MKRERFVLEDHNNTFSCFASTGKTGLLRGNHVGTEENAKADGRSTEEEINGEESPGERTTDKTRLIGGIQIGGALGAVMQAAHGR